MLTGIIIQTICYVIVESMIDPLKCNSQQQSNEKKQLNFAGVPRVI